MILLFQFRSSLSSLELFLHMSFQLFALSAPYLGKFYMQQKIIRFEIKVPSMRLNLIISIQILMVYKSLNLHSYIVIQNVEQSEVQKDVGMRVLLLKCIYNLVIILYKNYSQMNDKQEEQYQIKKQQENQNLSGSQQERSQYRHANSHAISQSQKNIKLDKKKQSMAYLKMLLVLLLAGGLLGIYLQYYSHSRQHDLVKIQKFTNVDNQENGDQDQNKDNLRNIQLDESNESQQQQNDIKDQKSEPDSQQAYIIEKDSSLNIQVKINQNTLLNKDSNKNSAPKKKKKRRIFRRKSFENVLEPLLTDDKYTLKSWQGETPLQKAKFYNVLFQYPENKRYQKIYEQRMNKLYNISEFSQQLPICVSIVGISTMTTYQKMIKSVFKQDYTNYKISFIDDHSPANIIEKVKELFIQEKSKAKNKNKMIEVHEQYNKAQVYSLKNRYDSLVNHCSEDDIVLDVDADDELVGNKVFQLVNTLYRRNKNVWAVYLNHFYREYDSKGNPEMKDTNLGQIPDETFEKNCYRTSYSWKTTALKSYRRKLFMKIDPTDYLDSEDKFYIEKADTFVHFALVQLAGKEHILKIDEPVYYYDKTPLERNRVKLNIQKQRAAIAAKVLIPYQNLNSLDDEPKRVENYVYPERVVTGFNKFISLNPKFKNSFRVTP